MNFRIIIVGNCNQSKLRLHKIERIDSFSFSQKKHRQRQKEQSTRAQRPNANMQSHPNQEIHCRSIRYRGQMSIEEANQRIEIRSIKPAAPSFADRCKAIWSHFTLKKVAVGISVASAAMSFVRGGNSNPKEGIIGDGTAFMDQITMAVDLFEMPDDMPLQAIVDVIVGEIGHVMIVIPLTRYSWDDFVISQTLEDALPEGHSDAYVQKSHPWHVSSEYDEDAHTHMIIHHASAGREALYMSPTAILHHLNYMVPLEAEGTWQGHLEAARQAKAWIATDESQKYEFTSANNCMQYAALCAKHIGLPFGTAQHAFQLMPLPLMNYIHGFASLWNQRNCIPSHEISAGGRVPQKVWQTRDPAAKQHDPDHYYDDSA